ncbi:similar to Saccharomyces cerevisiae YMR276W DSK2 Nuclear-enriched ubiquitin-like polyubiquitin-binding protein [Geotrichum candidum]|uniref:Similar to Saccharomyces cerevisiae YMR276W DSK2 Nuclear-enriched ubiquitin-like polyubiquitin-binding protein n=1 Tax=Geotrichum candidum TaxID=1173061 RepID=A0A0J9X583_GEOCN|nr:similar to Saccharomyces cerevisiae YMR276W DSK2 Nuclear-enriched ubiquitin-like polyubiquitin-binding protein [Geotrichum candidum]
MSESAEEVTIIIKSSADKKYEVTISLEATVAELKEVLAEKSSIPADRQRVIFSGRILKDPETLSSYKIKNGNSLHLIRGAPPKDSSSSSAAGSGPAASSTPATPANIATGINPGNPLADLTGARYAGYASLPNASMFGPDGGMGANPNTDDIISMMSAPGFREQMEAMLSNPSMVEMMINSNPQLRQMGPQIRSMIQSPMFRNMMSNPDALRQMMQLQSMMGGDNGFGQPASSFPAPGAATNDSTERSTESSTTNTNTTPNANAAANPFASLLGGANPDAAANPFAALLNPSLGNPGAGAGYNPELLASLLGGGAAAPQPEDNRPPEERYEAQLRQLNELGFFDFDRNVRALRRSGGNVNGAVEALLDDQL